MARAKEFGAETPLEKLIVAGNVDGTIGVLDRLPEDHRQRLRSRLVQMLDLMRTSRFAPGVRSPWVDGTTPDQNCAIAVALLLCGRPSDAAVAFTDDERVFAMLHRLRPPVLAGLGEELLPFRFRWVHRLIVEGLIERPTSDAYILGLITLPQIYRDRDALNAEIARDAGILQVLPRVFEVEGTADCCLASVEKYSGGRRPWTTLFMDCCARGIYSREQLLQLTLGALERGWIQHRSGWFSRFHKALDPSADEMRPHLSTYLALCGSRIPPTVTLALESLQRIDAEQPMAADALLDALRPVASSAVKAQVESALGMIASICEREPTACPRAAEVVGAALAHDSRDIQARALALLGGWGVGTAARAKLRDYLPGIAATNREALLELIGEPAARVDPRREEPQGAAPTSPLVEQHRIQPVGDLQELVELISHAFENETDIDAFERAIAGLTNLSPIDASEQTRFSPVLKRAAKVHKPIPQQLARLLVFSLHGERRGTLVAMDDGGMANPAQQVLARRVDGLIDTMSARQPFTPLASPTHSGGSIDACAFVERLQAHIASETLSSTLEQVMALLRLSVSEEARMQARSVPDSPLTRALRYALGDDVAVGSEEALYTAAARIRHSGRDDAALLARFGDAGPDAAKAARYTSRVHTRPPRDGSPAFHDFYLESSTVSGETPMELLSVWRHPRPGKRYGNSWRFGGADEGMIRWSASLQPDDCSAFCAEGARAIGENLDWWYAAWHNKAYIEHLHRSEVRITGPAALLLVLALSGKEPGQTALAVDALVHGWLERRLDVSSVARELGELLGTPLLKTPRLAKSLQASRRIEPHIDALLFDLLCEAIALLRPETKPDLAKILELLLEVKTTAARELPEPTTSTLGALPLSGRAATLRKLLTGTKRPRSHEPG